MVFMFHNSYVKQFVVTTTISLINTEVTKSGLCCTYVVESYEMYVTQIATDMKLL
jgi:hypothetical protein